MMFPGLLFSESRAHRGKKVEQSSTGQNRPVAILEIAEQEGVDIRVTAIDRVDRDDPHGDAVTSKGTKERGLMKIVFLRRNEEKETSKFCRKRMAKKAEDSRSSRRNLQTTNEKPVQKHF